MINITYRDWNSFLELRKELFQHIKLELAQDGHCKSYEGCFEFTIKLPDYFEESDGKLDVHYVIELHLYLIAPRGRHHKWIGKSFKEALDQAERDIRKWLEWHTRILAGEDVPEMYEQEEEYSQHSR